MSMSMHVTLSWIFLGYSYPLGGDDILTYSKPCSQSWYTVDGQMPTASLWDPLAGIYRTKDGSCVRLHTNFPQ